MLAELIDDLPFAGNFFSEQDHLLRRAMLL